MHDRAVRRRRAVLVVLVAASLFLLTVYFGEGSSGSLHSVQRGVMGVLSPIQEGANRVLKPVRDLFGWFGDTLNAKGERDKYKEQAEAYYKKLGVAEQQVAELQQRSGLKALDETGGMNQYGPVEARVYLRSPNAFFQRMTINKGTSDGIHAGDPVVAATPPKDGVAGGALIGKILTAGGGSSVVTLITDQDFSVSALAGQSREPGSVEPAIGAPGDLLLNMVQNTRAVHVGDFVFTAGTVVARLESRYPPAIPIGTVSRVDPGSGDLDRRIHVKPAADLTHTDIVQVLTEPHADLQAAVK
jgi:rod shape-determining protein MreC